MMVRKLPLRIALLALSCTAGFGLVGVMLGHNNQLKGVAVAAVILGGVTSAGAGIATAFIFEIKALRLRRPAQDRARQQPVDQQRVMVLGVLVMILFMAAFTQARALEEEKVSPRRRQQWLEACEQALSMFAFMLPSAIRSDAVATARDVFYDEVGYSETRRQMATVLLRLMGRMLTTGLAYNKRRLAGMASGGLGALTAVASLQSLVGWQVNALLGAVLVVLIVAVGSALGGWVAGIAERRVP